MKQLKRCLPSRIQFLLLLLCFGLTKNAMSQASGRQAPPSWITMMDDPNVNYFQAVTAFQSFWKGRVTPIEESELFETEGKKEKENELRERKQKRLKKDDPAIVYAYEYKRFLWWMKEVEPFVQEDGRILSMDARIEQWKQSKAHKRQQDVKQKKSKSGN